MEEQATTLSNISGETQNQKRKNSRKHNGPYLTPSANTTCKKQGTRKEGIVKRTEKRQLANKSEKKIPKKPWAMTCKMIYSRQNIKAEIPGKV